VRHLVVLLVLAIVAGRAHAGPGDGVLPLPPERPAPTTEAPPAALDAMRDACEISDPTCDPSLLFSALEQRAVDRALAAEHLEIDHAPQGKKIGRLYFAQFKVFGPGDGFLRWFNYFHITTKASAVARELVFDAGDPWVQSKVDESARRLRDPLSTSLVAIVPIVSPRAGEVDAMVVTRDVWSVRLNSNYAIQDQQLTLLSFSLSENNLLGRRKLLAAAFRMDQATYFAGPVYIDHNFLGRHLQFVERAGPIFNRDSLALEGSESSLSFGLPLWSLASKWGATVDWTHHFAIDRSFQGTGLRTYDDPATPIDDHVPYEYKQHRLSLTLTGLRGWGDQIAQRMSAGYQLVVQRPQLLPDFPDDAQLRSDFTRDVLPRSERTSALFVGYSMFESRYRNFQNVSTFELAEDTRMGAAVDVTAALGLGILGSESNFLRLNGTVSYTAGMLGDGLWRITTSGQTRLERGHAIDNVVSADLRFVSPRLGPVRVLTEGTLSGIYRDTQNQFYTVGGDNGLRGYPIGEFSGDRRALWQTEVRTRPIGILFTRWGAVAFHELAGAAQSFRSMTIYQDVGAGVRFLIPQLESDLFRFDLSLALSGPFAGKLRFTAGYQQSF
jgi:hypothetical protein